MDTLLSRLVLAVVLLGGVTVVPPAQAQVSIQIGPPPSPYHFWVPERRVWDGRRHVRTPAHWERRSYRRDHHKDHHKDHHRQDHHEEHHQDHHQEHR